MKPPLWTLVLWLLVAVNPSASKHLSRRDRVPDDESLYPEPKYFNPFWRSHFESHYAHYDARYMVESLAEEPHRDVIRTLVQTYLATCHHLGIQTWLMHGTLLGWWWGQKVMPWDKDADVQVTEADMKFLATYHNMTVYYYHFGAMKEGRYFLLDVNPHWSHRETDDWLNLIDARWIDMKSGSYIDITAARYDPDHPAGSGMLYDKNRHEFRDTYLFPLLQTTFEGMPASIPYKYEAMLKSEYGDDALTNQKFKGHVFDQEAMQWVLEPRASQDKAQRALNK